MSRMEEWRINRKVKKEKKAFVNEERRVEALTDSNQVRIELSHKKSELREKAENQEWLSRKLDEKELNEIIKQSRQNLFIQRGKLENRIINANREYRYIQSTAPEGAKKQKELERCEFVSKNAFYALGMVNHAIERLDEIPSEYEWRQIMRDLTNGYKTVNKISLGSDIMTRLALLIQKARFAIKGNLSVQAMEEYFGKPIDQLIGEETSHDSATQTLVKDDVLKIDNADSLEEALRWGTLYTVQPQEMVQVATEQSTYAEQKGTAQAFSNPTETEFDITSLDIDDALEKIPGNV